MKSPVQDRLLYLIKKKPGLTTWQYAELAEGVSDIYLSVDRILVARRSRQFILAAKKLLRKEEIVVLGKKNNKNVYGPNKVPWYKRAYHIDKRNKRLNGWPNVGGGI